MNKKLLSVILSATILAGSMVGCGKKSETSESSESTGIKVGTFETVGTVQPFFYGEYSDETENLEVETFKNPEDMKKELLSGNLSLAGASWVTAIKLASEGEPVKVVAVMAENNSDSVNELKDSMIENAYDNENVGNIGTVILATEKEIEENPEKMRELMDKHVKSSKYLMENKEEWTNKVTEFGVEKEDANRLVESLNLTWDISPEKIDEVKKLAEKMKELGMIENVPDVDSIFDFSFIENAKMKR